MGLSRRAASSPAAASHPSGSWHVRNSQLSGFVLIDKNENSELKELSNRQGLEENDSYQLFVEIILSGISAFERYRQSIIRDIKKQTPDEESENSIPMMSSIIKNPKKILGLNEKEHLALVVELKSFVKKVDRKEEQKQAEIERLKYDTRILNTLATSGLKSTSLAHELKNSKNFILSAPCNLEEALKQFGYWDDLLSPEKTKYSYHNVPSIIERLGKENKRIAYFISSVLEDVENKRFIKIGINLKEIFNGIVTRWTSYYKWVHIKVKNNSTVSIFNISEDILRVVFDNLILNSIQQNSSLDQLLINIDISKQENKLLFEYYDNGVGLNRKYKDEPARIFESHETTRPNGHGLGMWILKNTLDYCDGEIIDIPTSQKGFKLIFSIGEITENGN